MILSPVVLDHANNPRNTGPLVGATHIGRSGIPGDGPYMVMYFQVTDETIDNAAYQTYGCPVAMASGSVIAQILRGKSITTALAIEPEDVSNLLQGVPEGKEYCAKMVVEATRKAFGSLQ